MARPGVYVPTRTEPASGPAKQPYGLRHAGISCRLYSCGARPNALAAPARASRCPSVTEEYGA
ncbi:hypothetical protein JCM4914_10460 [Streptomyces platensis subsp. malvinus]